MYSDEYTKQELVRQKFRVRVVRVSNVPPRTTASTKKDESATADMPTATVVMSLFHGTERVCADQTSTLCTPEGTSKSSRGHNWAVAWNQWLMAPISYYNVPLACRIMFKVAYSDGTLIGWAGLPLFSYDHEMRTGKVRLRLFETEKRMSDAATSMKLSNVKGGAPILEVELMSFEKPVLAKPSIGASPRVSEVGAGRARASLSFSEGHLDALEVQSLLNDSGLDTYGASGSRRAELGQRLRDIVAADPLHNLSAEDKALCWAARDGLSSLSAALPKFLESVRWNNAGAVAEARHVMFGWAKPRVIDALQLLDRRFPDPVVRAYAVCQIDTADDATVMSYLLQLCQTLKFEQSVNTSLSRFLLRRALRSPRTVGHMLFWYLKSEVHEPGVSSRFKMLLEHYLRNCGEHRTELGHQMFIMSRLEACARKVKTASGGKKGRVAVIRGELPQIVFPMECQLPLSPHVVSQSIVVEECKVMDSKKLPLWLTFESVRPDEPPHRVLLKVGDDLRQDQLTLQVLQIMDKLWKASGLDLKLWCYACVATGNEVGMLEVVPDSNTLAGIVNASVSRNSDKVRGKFGHRLRAAMSVYTQDDVLVEWLSEQGYPEDTWRHNFLMSCAGCCVATFVLGIGDRHNDNIMLCKDGRLFHIDFGHFLGNFKKKYGYKREKAPFVFTPAFAAVIGGPGTKEFRKFEDICCRAFNVLRHNSQLLITLFYLMISGGIPELEKEEDIYWIRDKLMLEKSDAEAAEAFKDLIHVSMNTKTTQFNDACHILKHG